MDRSGSSGVAIDFRPRYSLAERGMPGPERKGRKDRRPAVRDAGRYGSGVGALGQAVKAVRIGNQKP
jgi:hypothetical protein